jgi:hypothetical protein
VSKRDGSEMEATIRGTVTTMTVVGNNSSKSAVYHKQQLHRLQKGEPPSHIIFLIRDHVAMI